MPALLSPSNVNPDFIQLKPTLQSEYPELISTSHFNQSINDVCLIYIIFQTEFNPSPNLGFRQLLSVSVDVAHTLIRSLIVVDSGTLSVQVPLEVGED